VRTFAKRKVTTSLRLPVHLHAYIKAISKRRGLSINTSIIIRLEASRTLDAYLSQHEGDIK
jgi:predicted DNA-binding protein